MKRKLFAILLAITVLVNPAFIIAQEGTTDTATAEASATDTSAATEVKEEAIAPPVEEEVIIADDGGSHNTIKNKFIEGGPGFMALVLVCLILGLAVAIERIITLFMAGGNSEAFKNDIEAYLKNKDIEGAKELCRNTAGPVASIYYQGLDRTEEGLQVVEGTVSAYGSVQVSKLESGMVWLSLCIALAPMLGFLGTVIGMIQAFDDIQAQGDISPTVVAGGIKVALITTVAGLIVAIILQIFYNFITSKIDSMIGDMENSSIDLVDMMLKNHVLGNSEGK
jgi:biopolymer transport protein ExbB